MNEKEEIVKDLKDILKKNLEVMSSLVQEGNSSRLRRGLQHFTFLKFTDRHKPLFDSIMSHAIQAEKLCPGSGLLFLKKFCGVSETTGQKRPRNKSDLRRILQDLSLDSSVRSLLITSLDFCSSNTKLSVKKSLSGKTFVEITEGYIFEVKPLLSQRVEDLKNARICCIDGYIENVSEIHRLLTDLSDKKESCVILCRGMSNDVLHTLKVNLDRRTVIVYPYIVPFDTENVNTLVDVATVSGTDVTSSLKGDLLSTIDLSRTGLVENCLLSGNSLRILNRKTKENVRRHVSHLRQLVLDRPELEEILSKRMRSLNSSCIEIAIPDDIKYYSVSQQLDFSIRIISSIMSNTYDPEGSANIVYESFSKFIDNTELHLLC